MNELFDVHYFNIYAKNEEMTDVAVRPATRYHVVW